SLVELSIVVGALAALALVYTLAERHLPMGEHQGHLVGAFLGSGKPDATPGADAPAPGRSAEPLFDGAGGVL
ncbi:MAG TPA: hypothetical protein VF302_04700, partial [Candidatus Limnocylindrales bacterium]